MDEIKWVANGDVFFCFGISEDISTVSQTVLMYVRQSLGLKVIHIIINLQSIFSIRYFQDQIQDL